MSSWLNNFDSNILTSILTSFVNAFSMRFSSIEGYANGLFKSLLLIELIFFGLMYALSGGDILAAFVKKILLIGFFQFLLFKYVWLVDVLMRSFVNAGLQGGDLSMPQLLDPSALIKHGFKLSYGVMQHRLENMSWSNFAYDAFGLLSYMSIFVMFIAYIVLGLQIFLTMTEYYIITTLAILLIPFGIMKPTFFLAERAINAIIAVCVKLFVLAFVGSISIPVLSNLSFPGPDPTLIESISMMIGVLAIVMITMRAPAIAYSLVNGSSSMDIGNSFIQPLFAASGARQFTQNTASFASNAVNKSSASLKNIIQAAKGRSGN